MSQASLAEISDINEHMKLVLKESRRLYRVSLNAMFVSRRINVGIDGFVEVTSLFRDFSAQLNTQVNKLSGSVNQAIRTMVVLSNIRNRARLVNSAIKMSGLQNVKLQINSNLDKLMCESDYIIAKIHSEIGRFLKLIQVGESLTVLAKVEAKGVPVAAGDLDTITNDMDCIMLNITENILITRNYIT